MIKPVSAISINNKIAFKSNLNKLQDEINAEKRLKFKNTPKGDSNNSIKSMLAGYSALILTILAIGATISTAILARKENTAKRAVENIMVNDTVKTMSKDSLNILR